MNQAESAIHVVIGSLIESQEALVEIGEKLDDQNLKRYFLVESLIRAQFRNELESVLNHEGISDLRENGSSAGDLHQIWAGLRFKSVGGDQALLEIAEQVEGITEEGYLSAMSTALPLPVRQILSTQVMYIHESHDYVKAARDRVNRTAA